MDIANECRGGGGDRSPGGTVNLPNLITLARLISVPVAVWMIVEGFFLYAFWLFVAAGISDALDGFIAKRFNAQSQFGSFLDPLADKALLVSVYVALGHDGHVEPWLVILVVSRDVMIIGGVVLMWMLTDSYRVVPSVISKFNTVAQILLAAMVLAKLGMAFDDLGVTVVMTYLVAATTLLSGAGYLVAWVRRAATMEDAT